MRRSSWKITLGYFIVVIIAFVIIVNYKTNHNWRNRDLIQRLIDVPNKEFIKRTDFWEGSVPGIDFKIKIQEQNLSDEDIYQMLLDISANIDEYIYYGMDQTISFTTGDLWVVIYSLDNKVLVSGKRDLMNEIIEDGTIKYYHWDFYNRLNKETEIKISPYPDRKGE